MWQFVLTFLAVVFALSRVATAILLSAMSPDDPGGAAIGYVVPSAYGVQTLFALATAAGLWAGRPWVRIPLILLGLAAIGTAIVETWVGLRPPVVAVGQSLLAVAATGGLCFILTREFGTFDDPRVPSTDRV